MSRITSKKLLTITPSFSSIGMATHSVAMNGESGIPSPDRSSDSPLWMVTREPLLNELVMQLQHLRQALMQNPTILWELQFSRARLEEVRTAFANMIRHGEERLHLLAQLICEAFLASFQLESVVIGEIESTKERFTITQSISIDDLYSTTDIDLGNRQLSKLRFFDGRGWSKASLVANVVDYQPTEPNPYAIHRIISRIKAEEEIWNKVVDEIFDLDRIVRTDKKLRHLSRYVKDIFGLKIVVGEVDDVQRVLRALVELNWPDEYLKKFHIQPREETRRLEFIEVKDYLSHEHRKRTGWEAVKAVVRWSNKTFEIQIQPLRNFLREREFLTRESHTSFKAHREKAREQVARQIPLFRFYRDLLLWLFRNPDASPPVYERVVLKIID